MIVVDGKSETRYYCHLDGLGSVVAISDDGGQTTEKYEYDVFGEPTIYDTNDQIPATIYQTLLCDLHWHTFDYLLASFFPAIYYSLLRLDVAIV